MPRKTHIKNPRQQKPYINQRINGKSFSKNGNESLNKSNNSTY